MPKVGERGQQPVCIERPKDQTVKVHALMYEILWAPSADTWVRGLVLSDPSFDMMPTVPISSSTGVCKAIALKLGKFRTRTHTIIVSLVCRSPYRCFTNVPTLFPRCLKLNHAGCTIQGLAVTASDVQAFFMHCFVREYKNLFQSLLANTMLKQAASCVSINLCFKVCWQTLC